MKEQIEKLKTELPEFLKLSKSIGILSSMAQCLLVAVEALEDIERGDIHCHAEHDERAADALMQILNIWENAK
jgi:hypothetical protein